MVRMTSSRFKRLPRKQEIEVVRTDTPTFMHTRRYLQPLIQRAMERADIPLKDRPLMQKRILSDVPVAAKRFLARIENEGEKNTIFSVYFTWYIAQRLNA